MTGPDREADFTLQAVVGANANARTGTRSAAKATAQRNLDARLAAVDKEAGAEAYQFEVYEAGKAAGYENLRDWFKSLHEILIGSQNGPRMCGFIALYGLAQSRALIADALKG
jgi:lysyl-tRNA synthetase, class I